MPDLTANVRKRETEMYRSYDVTIEFTSPCHGGVPQAEGVMEKWIDARVKQGKLGKDESDRIKAEYVEEMQKADEPTEKATETAKKERLCSFRRDKVGIYIECRQVKAMLKEAAITTGRQRDKKHRGSKQVWQTGTLVTEPGAGDYHGEGKLRFMDGEETVTAPDDTLESVVHAMTPQGPRTSIKLNDFVEAGRRMHFRVWTLELGKEGRAICDAYITDCLANGPCRSTFTAADNRIVGDIRIKHRINRVNMVHGVAKSADRSQLFVYRNR